MLHGVGLVVLIVLLAIAFAAVSGRGDSAMAARLGDVIYCDAPLLGGILIFGAGFAAVFGTGRDRFLMDALIAVIALVVWLVGRACRCYVLAGR